MALRHSSTSPPRSRRLSSKLLRELLGQPQGDSRLRTSGGSITAHIGTDIALDVHARTSGGRVRVDDDIQLDGELTKKSAHGRINGGGPSLRARTSGGSIRLAVLP